MPRRPLRKIATPVDLTQYLWLPEALPRPWNSEVVFGRQAPLEIEVGSGKGLFLRKAAVAAPERNFLGMELAQRYAHYGAGRIAAARLSNARIVHGNALEVFADLLPDSSAAAVHVYFPDPWWKKRHKKRRVLNEAFVRDVERLLEPGGVLHFWTDVEEYYLATLELLQTTTGLSGPHAVPERPAEHELDYRTHFERRTRLHGEPVYRAQFHKSRE